MEKQIDYRFKILYALAIVMVVCGHTGNGGTSILNEWFPYYGLHLELFLFCSGYFYKRENENGAGKYILKKVKRLIVPLYLYNIAYGLIVQALKLFGFTIGGAFTLKNLFLLPITQGNAFGFNMPSWFVMPLFMTETFNVLFRKLAGKLRRDIPEWVFFAVFLALGIFGNTLAGLGYTDGWQLVLVRMLYFFPFFALGGLFRRYLEKPLQKIPGIWYFSAIFAAKLIIALICGRMPTYTTMWFTGFDDGPVLPIINGALGIAFWMRAATMLEPVLGRNRLVNRIADSTFSIMENHYMGAMLVKTCFAFLKKLTPFLEGFDMVRYKSELYWFYIPRGINQFYIVYAAAGIAFGVAVQMLINAVKRRAAGLLRERRGASKPTRERRKTSGLTRGGRRRDALSRGDDAHGAQTPGALGETSPSAASRNGVPD